VCNPTVVRALPQQESFESLMALAKELCTTGFLPVAVKIQRRQLPSF
jgi:hypothetical protein